MKLDILESVGLGRNEAGIYQLLLEKGEMAPPEIARRLGLNRARGYQILKTLLSKGLVEELTRKKKLIYRASAPNALEDLVNSRRAEIESAGGAISAMVPELMSLYNLTYSKPGITYFEGLAGIKRVYEDRLKEKPEEVLVFRSAYDKKRLGNFLVGIIKRTALAGIKTRIISSATITDEKRKDDRAFNRERKHVPFSVFATGTQIDIYNNKVAFINLDKKIMGFIVTSSVLADTMRAIFELSWNTKIKD